MGDATTYLLTWTTYGTWLHGDRRGSIDRMRGEAQPRLVLPNPYRASFERSELKNPPVEFGVKKRAIVGQAINDHAMHRGWHLYVQACRTNQVHVVLRCPCQPDKAIREFKAWATGRPAGCVLPIFSTQRYASGPAAGVTGV